MSIRGFVGDGGTRWIDEGFFTIVPNEMHYDLVLWDSSMGFVSVVVNDLQRLQKYNTISPLLDVSLKRRRQRPRR